MSASQATTKGSAPRVAFGVVLFVAWGLATIVWVASTVNLAADGDAAAIVTAIVAFALLALLAGMEGLEVAVIDRWRAIYPDRPTSQLAAWLAARQLFVAAHRDNRHDPDQPEGDHRPLNAVSITKAPG